MFGEKEFRGVGYPTPLSIPEDTTCYLLQVPASADWWAIMLGLMLHLCDEENWQQMDGGISKESAAQRWFDMFIEATDLASESNQCSALVPAPFWDDPNADDADDEAPADDQDWYGVLIGEETWQEQIEDWAIAAFVATAATPAAAIAFLTIAPKFRLAWKTSNWGAIVKIFIDQVEIGTVDTYAAEPGIVTFDVDVPQLQAMGADVLEVPVELWIEHTGTHNEAATPDTNGDFTIQVIRKLLADEAGTMATELRQNEDNPCVLEYSIDGGETWLTAFDYALCTSPAQGVPEQIPDNPAAPDDTFTSQDGDSDEQRQARFDGLCYASGKIVDSMLSAAYEVCNGNATGINLGAIALGIITVILIGVDIITAGSLTALVMLALAALLEIAGQVTALSCNVYLDTDVRDRLVCMVVQNLMNRAVTLENFQHAFDHQCDTGDVSDVANVFANMLQSPSYAQRLYKAFLSSLGEAQSAALQGATIETCICAAETWSMFWNFMEDGAQGWEETDELGDVTNQYFTKSVFEAGCGFVSKFTAGVELSGYWDDCTFSEARCGAAAARDIFIPDGCTITAIDISVDTNCAGSLCWTVIEVDGVCYTGAPHTFSTPIGAGNHHIVIAHTNNYPSSGVHLKGISMTGDGLNPVQACDKDFETLDPC